MGLYGKHKTVSQSPRAQSGVIISIHSGTTVIPPLLGENLARAFVMILIITNIYIMSKYLVYEKQNIKIR